MASEQKANQELESSLEKIQLSLKEALESLQSGQNQLNRKEETLPVRLIECMVDLRAVTHKIEEVFSLIEGLESDLYEAFEKENPNLMDIIIQEHVNALK